MLAFWTERGGGKVDWIEKYRLIASSLAVLFLLTVMSTLVWLSTSILCDEIGQFIMSPSYDQGGFICFLWFPLAFAAGMIIQRFIFYVF